MAALDVADRQNSPYARHLLTERGDVELAVPRSRRFTPTAVLRPYGRRAKPADRMILACFVLGLSTRRLDEALLPIFGRAVNRRHAMVSVLAKQLDTVVAIFDTRPLNHTSHFLRSGLSLRATSTDA